MEEVPATPISRGVEIQKAKIEEIQKRALDRYKDVTALSKRVEAKIDAALAKAIDQETLNELAELFEKKHVVEQIGQALEEMILRTFERQDDLQGRWAAIEEKLHSCRIV
jgi:BMFP domain-containing protein YqiC